jgi:transporter family-2 protein
MMPVMVLLALAGGVAVTLSRMLNGRLALATSPLVAAFWNHAVGLAAICAWALAFGGLAPDGLPQAPWWAWAGGPLGVGFIAAGSYLVARIGAVATALLVIAGQMLAGVALDAATGLPADLVTRATGVLLILAGMGLIATRPKA